MNMSARPPWPAGGLRITYPNRRSRPWYRSAMPLVPAVIGVGLTPPLLVVYASQLPGVSAVANDVPSDTNLPTAVVAAEDHNFYQEHGIDPAGIARAARTVAGSRSMREPLMTQTGRISTVRCGPRVAAAPVCGGKEEL